MVCHSLNRLLAPRLFVRKFSSSSLNLSYSALDTLSFQTQLPFVVSEPVQEVICESLSTHGYVKLTNIVSPSLGGILRQEAEDMFTAGHFEENYSDIIDHDKVFVCIYLNSMCKMKR